MISISPINDKDINGIIHEIYQQYEKEYQRYVTTSESSTFNERRLWSDASTLINYTKSDDDDYCSWTSHNVMNSNFSIYFLQFQIYITNYSFRSRTFNNNDMPRGWIVEGSNNNETWYYIDQKRDEDSLLQPKAVKTFHVDKEGIYRYFRFTQNQNNSRNLQFFSLNQVDFFGYTIDDCQVSTLTKNSCVKKRSLLIYLFIINHAHKLN